MVIESQIRKVIIDSPEYVELVKKTAKRLEFGGKSSVYSDHEYRMQKLEENQLTGQLGECATITTLFGFDKYIEKANEEVIKGQGDFGNDIPGAWLPIDVKSSNINIPFNKPGSILNHRRLFVSKKEHNPNSIYIGCALSTAPSHNDNQFEVWVMGWCWGREMHWDTWTCKATGEERQAWRRKYGHLNPMSRIPFEHKSWWDLLDVNKAA